MPSLEATGRKPPELPGCRGYQRESPARSQRIPHSRHGAVHVVPAAAPSASHHLARAPRSSTATALSPVGQATSHRARARVNAPRPDAPPAPDSFPAASVQAQLLRARCLTGQAAWPPMALTYHGVGLGPCQALRSEPEGCVQPRGGSSSPEHPAQSPEGTAPPAPALPQRKGTGATPEKQGHGFIRGRS